MCREWIVTGRVQGVFFRASTAGFARPMGLIGEARNLPDGTVRVRACGGTDELARLGDWLQSGPPMARVDSVHAAHAECVAGDGFVTA
ncbi:MAG: acylphosphatase [Gammaproteobacteria bacterium]